MALEFRPYRKRDRDTCLEIFRSQIGHYLAPGEETAFQKFLTGAEKGGDHYFVLARFEGRAVGFGGVQCRDEVGSLTYGILRKGELSKGFGKGLLHHRIGWVLASHPKVKSILCDTAPLTEGFFAKFGFETYYRAEKYWAGELDLVAMELSFDGVKRGGESTQRFRQSETR